MSISPLYIPLFTIEEVILNKDNGLPLSGGVVKFYRDSQRVTPKPVYQISGTSPNYTFESVGNELTLGISGTFVDTDGNPFVPYAFPYDADGAIDLYYVTVVSQGGVPQFVRQAVPYTGSEVVPPEERSNTENELCNPQFVEVLFPSVGASAISVTGTNTVTPIAPGWDLVSSGTGTITVERLEPTAAGVITNPSYALRINADAALGASIVLRQRLNNSPSVLRGGFVSATLTAAVISGGGTALSLSYAPSTGTATTIIPSTNVSTDGAYHTLAGNIEVPDQANDPASIGYIDINITIPTARNIAITSIQVVGVAFSIDIPFDQQTADRQKDHLFHYYQDSILRQPKESLLTGWNFSLNPWQYYSTTHGNVATNEYTADQTIMIQQAYVDTLTGNNVSVSQSGVSNNRAYDVAAVGAANKFALVQYISPQTIKQYWGQKLSSLVRVLFSSPSHSTTMRIKMRLIYRNGAPYLPPAVSRTEPISSWTNIAGSDPTFASGWTAILPENDPTYTLNNSYQELSFNKFQLPTCLDDDMTLGVVIYTLDNMDPSATTDSMLFQDVSLVNNDFGIKSSTETYDVTLRKCQFYYETSYPSGSLAGTATTVNGQISTTVPVSYGSPDDTIGYKTFQVSYKSVKRSIVTPSFYSPASATSGLVQVGVRLPGSGFVAGSPANISIAGWTATGSSVNGINMIAANPGNPVPGIATNFSHEAVINYHYVCDARLGV